MFCVYWGVCKRYSLLYILSETVGEPTIHDFCEHTYAHQWEFPSTTKIILRKQCKALSEYVKKIV